MRSLALCLLAIASSSSAVAEEGYHIGRWGNMLMVTAPGGGGLSKEIAGRLDQRITINFQDSSITEVANFLRSVSQINIVISPEVTQRAPVVTLNASDMTLKNVLHWVTTLTKTHMGYVHGALYIADKPIEAASVTRLYDISDLTMGVRDFPGPEMALDVLGGNKNGGGVFIPPIEDSNKVSPTSDDIEDLIRKVIKPEKWE